MKQENPKKQKTKSFLRYEKYKAATTVAEFLQLGGLKEDVKFDYQRGYLAVVGDDGSHQWASLDQGVESFPAGQQHSESSGSVLNAPANLDASVMEP